MTTEKLHVAPRHFIDMRDLSKEDVLKILDDARRMKARVKTPQKEKDRVLERKKIALIFGEPSMRTRVSFDVGIRDMGGEPLSISAQEIEFAERETIYDTAQVLSRYVDAIIVRVLNHDHIKELARHAQVPVVNGLTRFSHPCQVMADLLTIKERLNVLEGLTIAWMGPANNVLRSWMEATTLFSIQLNIAAPAAFSPSEAQIAFYREKGAAITLFESPESCVKDADCVITDCWVSMGDLEEETRKAQLQPYQVNDRLMAYARPHAIFMHCLPATRGEEVSDSVIDGPQSAVFDEAENRVHAQKAVLAWLFDIKIA